MSKMGIYNKNYGRKKGLKSKCQFDSWLVKVKNRPEIHDFRWCAIDGCKDLDEGYNFTSNISIKFLHKKLWASKLRKNPILGFSRFSTWESQEKWHLGAVLVVNHK